MYLIYFFFEASKATVCSACKLTLNSEAQALQHYKGKSHLNRIKELELSSEGGSGIGEGGGGMSVQSKAAAFQAGNYVIQLGFHASVSTFVVLLLS